MNSEGSLTTTFYGTRFLARLLDFLIITLVYTIFSRLFKPHGEPFFLIYYCYYLIPIWFSGTTPGRYCFGLVCETESDGVKGQLILSVREILFLILFPFLILNTMSLATLPWHDRITGIRVLRDVE